MCTCVCQGQNFPSSCKESYVLHVCVCMCILCATFMLLRCSIFRQFLVKMIHLSGWKVVLYSVHVYCVSCCEDVELSVSMHISTAEEVLFISV